MLLEYGLTTLVAVVSFTIADRKTQLGILGMFLSYTYVVLEVFPA